MPRRVQKDPEAALTWRLKDELVGRARVYYAKLARGRAMFLAPRMIPYFHAVWGVRRSKEKQHLSGDARAVLRVLRREWELGTVDLRDASGVQDRKSFTRALDELQATMIVVPSRSSINRGSPTSGRSASDGLPNRWPGASAETPPSARSPAAFWPEPA